MATFTHYIGSDRNFEIAITQGGTPVNITGATITANFKKKATDTAAVLSKSTGTGGITITTPASGLARINMDEADFAGLAEQELVLGIKALVGTRTYTAITSVAVVPVP